MVLLTHLVVDFVEGVLQFPVDGCQLFEFPVGFMDGQQNLVHFIYGLVHGCLGEQHNGRPVLHIPLDRITLPQPCRCCVTLCRVNMQPVTMWLENMSRTMLKDADACSRRPTRPDSLKYFPAQIPSSSGDRTSSDTADSSRTLDEMFWEGNGEIIINIIILIFHSFDNQSWLNLGTPHVILPISVVYSQMSHQIKQHAPTWNVTQPIGRYRQSSSMLRYSATRAALWTRQWAASAWFPLSECFPAMFWSHVRRRSGEFW